MNTEHKYNFVLYSLSKKGPLTKSMIRTVTEFNVPLILKIWSNILEPLKFMLILLINEMMMLSEHKIAESQIYITI